MNISIRSKEDIKNYFNNLGYDEIQYSYNYNKSYVGMQSVNEIKNIHLITSTKDFKIWLYELELYNSTTVNKITNRFYNLYPEQNNLLIFADSSYKKLTFLNYIQGVNEKLKIRKLNIEDNHFTTTDRNILNKLDITKKTISDDMDIKDLHDDAFNIEKVTDEFFKTFKEQIDYLSKNIKGIDDKEDRKNYSVLLLSRMLFLYFIQKKKWLDGKVDYLYDRFLYCVDYKDINYYENILEPLFFNCLNKSPEDKIGKGDEIKVKRLYENFDRETTIEVDENFKGIPYLNGGLFEKHPKYEKNNNIHIENEVFESLFENLFQKYNFTVREDIGFDSDVAVDPELLGRIFENMINKEEREGTGSFYTPRPIISYMCKQSIKEYLLENAKDINKEKINMLVDNIENEKSNISLNKSEINTVINLLNKVKICDTAVGSGAYILGMLQLLVSLKRELYKHIGNDLYKDSYEIKKYIIKNNLSGVDIQEGAIDIAHLRVWLSLVVDYEAKNSNDIKPLPNLKYRLIHGNSLISKVEDIDIYEEDTKQLSVKYINRDKNKIIKDIDELAILKDEYFNVSFKEKQILENNIKTLKESIREYSIFNNEIYNENNLCFSWQLAFPDVFNNDNKSDRGFDIIIGNPPYVSTKSVNKLDYKNELQQEFEYIDDLYNHFTCRQFSLLKENGILSYITSNTFFTIQSKLNMRQLLQSKYIKELIVTPRAFNALVDTSIFIVKNINKEENYKLNFIDTSKCSIDDYYNLSLASKKDSYDIDINVYKSNIDNVFFTPDKINMQIYENIIPKVKDLYNQWWDKICTSGKIKQNDKLIKKYIEKNIKEKEITLLGLITDGGVGLQTANNGKFIGVKEGTESAKRIKETRVEKFYENIIKKKKNKAIFEKEYPNYCGIVSKNDVKYFLERLSEYEIRDIFDNLKGLIGRDAFGQGYIFRIINEAEIKNIDDMTGDEKLNGIDDTKRVYVQYDKGDKYGNRWYLETPFYINWSSDTVSFFINNSGKKGTGMPVVRNKQFYFREGFCWSDVNTIYLKGRVKEKSIYDVKSMSLFNRLEESIVSEKYFIAMINSKFISEFTSNFYNNTSTFQINDGRKIPIIIPTKEQLKYINDIVDNAIEIKKLQFNKSITEEKANRELQKIQDKIDKFVYELYDIKLED